MTAQVVIGIDPHKASWTAAAVDASLRVLATVRVAVKPPSSIEQEQNTVTTDHEATTVKVVGRHDPSVVPRAVPVVEAMLANVLADLYLRNRAARLDWPS